MLLDIITISKKRSKDLSSFVTTQLIIIIPQLQTVITQQTELRSVTKQLEVRPLLQIVIRSKRSKDLSRSVTKQLVVKSQLQIVITQQEESRSVKTCHQAVSSKAAVKIVITQQAD